MNCRFCQSSLETQFLDLGFAPPSNAYLTLEQLSHPETYFPLRVWVCESCWLVQAEDYVRAEALFDKQYAYFSSTSTSWLEHAREYCKQISTRLKLGSSSFVVEVACNDGYLLRNFADFGIPCLGVEPTESTAAMARSIGIEVCTEFFGRDLAFKLSRKYRKADLIVGNNVYAHVPDIRDFTEGLKALLAPGGTITLEFPHFLNLLIHGQFDTVYHEHFSYLSLAAVEAIFLASGLKVFHVEELPTHGGSLRVYGAHIEDARAVDPSVAHVQDAERAVGLQSVDAYVQFQARVHEIKHRFLHFLLKKKEQGLTVAGYGAAAKGNTLLNFSGVGPDLMEFVVDAALSKQGRYLPGSHIPILPVSELVERHPQVVVVLPWNIAAEIVSHLRSILGPETRIFTVVPEIREWI